MLELAAAAAGGAIGSLLRYGTGLLFARHTQRGDRATLTVNLTGSFILGLLIGLGIQERIPLLYFFCRHRYFRGLYDLFDLYGPMRTDGEGAQASSFGLLPSANLLRRVAAGLGRDDRQLLSIIIHHTYY